MHDKAADLEIAPELLPEELLDVRLIIHDEDERLHFSPPVVWGACRGKVM